jgi:hypothetical protein
MKRTLLASVAIVALTVPTLACGDMPICTVSDPTGTELNVRATAGGDILTTLENGVEIETVEYQTLEGQEWVQIALYAPSWGYVEKSQLNCNESDDYSEICTVASISGSLEVFEEASSASYSYGMLDTGNRVRPYDTVEIDGITWVAIERFSSDNVLGWVFASYIDCGEHEHDL